MNKCIQFVLSAMIALGLPLVAQTNAQLQVNTASPVLQAFNHDPEFVSEAGGVEPDVNLNCWSGVTLSASGSPALLYNAITLSAQPVMSTNCHHLSGFSCGGTVAFSDYGTPIGTVPVDSHCDPVILQPDFETAGRHHIEAVFQPDYAYYRPSSAFVMVFADKWPAPTTLTSSVGTSTYGQDVTFTVTVISDIEQPPTGRVKFIDGTTTFGNVALDENGVATLTKKNLAVGTHSITAEYYGDSLCAKTTSAVLTQVVNSASTTASLE